MQKKLLAVAVAGALGAPAAVLAQTSTVQIYGTMYLEYDYVDQGRAAATPGGATTGDLNNIDALQIPGSNIGFKGEEKLGGGLSAWFQCESTADPRGVSQEGWCTRNSALGLKGGFGNLFIGRWDTPWKRAYGPASVGANISGIWGSGNLTAGGAGSQIGAASRATFLRRQSNTINYDSPNFGGFKVMASFTTAQDTGLGGAFPGGTSGTSGATNNKPRVLSLGAQYSAGPIYVGAGYEQHRNFAGGGAPGVTGGDTDDRGWVVGAAYTWGPIRVGGLYTRQEFEPTVTTQSKVNAWQVGVDWRIVGPHGLRAAFTRAGDVKGNSTVGIGTAAGAATGVVRPAAIIGGRTGDTGADLWGIRYVYTFSKRTEFNFGYARLNNDARAGYRLRNTFGAPVAGGNNEDAWGASIRHRF